MLPVDDSAKTFPELGTCFWFGIDTFLNDTTLFLRVEFKLRGVEYGSIGWVCGVVRNYYCFLSTLCNFINERIVFHI